MPALAYVACDAANVRTRRGERRITTALVTGASGGIGLEIARVLAGEDGPARSRSGLLNVASTASFQPGPLMAVYYATKAYVLSLSEALAEETRGSGVTVTALCPGPAASGFQAGAAMEESRLVRGRTLPTAASVAAYGVAAMRKGNAVAVPGMMNKMLAASIRFTPRPIVRRLVHRMQADG